MKKWSCPSGTFYLSESTWEFTIRHPLLPFLANIQTVHEKYERLNLLKKKFFQFLFLSVYASLPIAIRKFSKIHCCILYIFLLSILCLYFGGREFRMDCYKNNKFIDRVIEFSLRKRIKLKHEWWIRKHSVSFFLNRS